MKKKQWKELPVDQRPAPRPSAIGITRKNKSESKAARKQAKFSRAKNQQIAHQVRKFSTTKGHHYSSV